MERENIENMMVIRRVINGGYLGKMEVINKVYTDNREIGVTKCTNR